MTEGPAFNLRGKRVWVAGEHGMVGAAIVRRLESEGCVVLHSPRRMPDLKSQSETEAWMEANRPQVVFMAAARVGGILANSEHPADFIYDNIIIQTNIIEASRKNNVEKLLSLGSSCIYPRLAAQPIVESALLTGPLEPTNEWYAIAKIAGLKLAEAYRKQYNCDYISAMPTNLYGPGDNFDLQSSHVLPALLRKVHEAKTGGHSSITLWGTGTPLREFLHVDDCADALVFIMKNYSENEHINVGSGQDQSIFDLATLICDIIGFKGQILLDRSKPDGTPRKLMSAEKLLGLNWRPSISLENGIASTYQWFLEHYA